MTDDRSELLAAVAAGDLDELIRWADRLCSTRDWDGVVLLRDRCRHALEERGLQLWPAAEYAEYRLALEAPASFAGPVVVEGAGRFALGPLWEVAAAHHPWTDLAPHVPQGPARSMAAHARVLRGEDLGADTSVDGSVLDLPFIVQPWEPAYPAPVYRADTADFPTPPLPELAPMPIGEPGEEIGDEEATDALLAVVTVWAEHSNGSRAAITTEGGCAEAIAALGYDDVLGAEIEPDDALAWMAWAGASGGAYGRRRGGPAGRFAAWSAAAAVAGLEWPVDPDELGSGLTELRWVLWQPRHEPSGWQLFVAAESAAEELAWAVAARDHYRDDDPLAADRPGPFAAPTE